MCLQATVLFPPPIHKYPSISFCNQLPWAPIHPWNTINVSNYIIFLQDRESFFVSRQVCGCLASLLLNLWVWHDVILFLTPDRDAWLVPPPFLTSPPIGFLNLNGCSLSQQFSGLNNVGVLYNAAFTVMFSLESNDLVTEKKSWCNFILVLWVLNEFVWLHIYMKKVSNG